MDDERVGNAQRTQVLDLLSRALEQGYVSLEEYEPRMAAVTGAKLKSELHAQLCDLPDQFQWDPNVAQPSAEPPRLADDHNIRAFAIAALALGSVSIPLSLCLVGWMFGLAAIFFSFPGSRGASGWSMALIGRVLGIIGIVLSAGVVAIVVFNPSKT